MEQGIMSEPSTSGCSKPLHVQRLEQALNLGAFIPENNISTISSDDEDYAGIYKDPLFNYDELLKDPEDISENGILNTDYLDMERSWLTDVMQEECDDTEDISAEEHLNFILKIHTQKKKISSSVQPEVLEQHMYYGAGILSNFDKYPEHKQTIQVTKGTKRKKDSTLLHNKSNFMPNVLHELQDDLDGGYTIDIQTPEEIKLEPPMKVSIKKTKGKKFKDDESKKKWEEMMLQKRRKLFSALIKKESGKNQRARVTKHKEMILQARKVALACQKVARNKALQSARIVKELQWRMKRLSRENLAYWKRSKRVDRENRRKLEKEAEEQRKIDYELIEAKRQQRKLNFLITQTELYAHFMSKKLGEASPEEQLRILSQLDEERIPRLATIDDYDSDVMKAKAIKNAHDAFQSEKARSKQFDMEVLSLDEKSFDTKKADTEDDFNQPLMFRGTLKAYQLRGMNWLANLYDQGISGILADEMGLGKTVQSIAFLSHLAEEQDLWGPYLVICPASTLHNWQQEFAKFVPNFKVVPYWGNPADRKILRQFWAQDGMHTKDAGFHVVITSYQIVISDVKYFNRIKWQYMVLDEAQAIKSTSSMRWKTLLGFNCRNRLLLSGTPIQNSMAELWALLHFIMPTLFDSHEEFNEWFSKDIESHAENKTGIDEKHLSRLHMILKPFMLRRIKKDVENELSDKIEIMVYCPLTTRQRLLYMALKQKIHIEDLLHYTVGGGDSHSVDKNFTSNLMNLVMQFRKVCNHPELFERRDAKSPIYLNPLVYETPFLVYDTNMRKRVSTVLEKRFLFSKKYIAQALTETNSLFNIFLALNISTNDVFEILQGNIASRWKHYFNFFNGLNRQYHDYIWGNSSKLNLIFSSLFNASFFAIQASNVLQKLIFTSKNTGSSVIYTHSDHHYYSMQETIEHRNIRCRINKDQPNDLIFNNSMSLSNSIMEFPYFERKPQIFHCKRTEIPTFLFTCMMKVCTQHPSMYCYSRKAAYDYKKHIDDWSWTALNYTWSLATNNKLVKRNKHLYPVPRCPVEVIRPINGWSNISIPDKETLVSDSGKLFVLDGLLKKLKEEGHRVLIYSQMTKMIDLLEEYMWHRHHKYMRLDGSSKISERRDMVADFQARADIFVFLLSTRAGGLGINLTAADTVIFYDSDWNPTVDQQAMDRAHRLGQTKQVTVYRLICKGSIEERILQRAREKSEIQNLVISGGSFKPETLKPKEVVSLLLDDEEIELKYRQRAEERKHVEDMREIDRKRKYASSFKTIPAALPAPPACIVEPPKRQKYEALSQESGIGEDQWLSVDSVLSSPPHSEHSADIFTTSDDLTDSLEIVDTPWDSNKMFNMYSTATTNTAKSPRNPPRGASKRGRPRGSRRISALGRFNSNTDAPCANVTTTSLAAGSITRVTTPPASVNSDMMLSPQYGIYDNPTPGGSSQTSPVSVASSCYSSPGVRRGPGRPRLKPTGPPNHGTRGVYRPRKPARPLPVPLPNDNNTTNQSYTYFLNSESDII